MGCVACHAGVEKNGKPMPEHRVGCKCLVRKMTMSHSLNKLTASSDARSKPYINNFEPFLQHPYFQNASVIRFLHYQKLLDDLQVSTPCFFLRHDFSIMVLIHDGPKHQNIPYEERIMGVLRTEYTSRKTQFDEWMFGLWTFFYEDVNEALVQFQKLKPECFRTITFTKPIPLMKEVAPFITEWKETYDLATSNCQVFIEYFVDYLQKRIPNNTTIEDHFFWVNVCLDKEVYFVFYFNHLM